MAMTGETDAAREAESIGDLVSRLIEEARDLVRAEIALMKAKLGERAAAYKSAIVFFAAAGVLALSALVALLVGLILSLATLIGPGLATAAVVIVTLVVAGILALVGKGRLKPAVIEAQP